MSLQQITDIELLANKTIKSVHRDDKYLVQIFQDDTFTVFKIDTGWEAGDDSIDICIDDYIHYSPYNCYEYGIISKEEYDIIENERENQRQKMKLEQDKREYLRLKNIFGN